VYISRLVKTRDLYPGLLQLAISFPFLSVCLLSCVLFFGLFLSSISIFISTLAFTKWKCCQAFSHAGDLLLSHIVSENQVTDCTATLPVQVGRTLSEALHQGKFLLASIVANQVTSNEIADSHSNETPITNRGKDHRAPGKGTPRKTDSTPREVSSTIVAY
jgi:hypothetical protein